MMHRGPVALLETETLHYKQVKLTCDMAPRKDRLGRSAVGFSHEDRLKETKPVNREISVMIYSKAK